jgi:hypothetical protein
MELPLKAASAIDCLADRRDAASATRDLSTEFHCEPRLFAFGIGWFLVGVLVYLIARPRTISAFFPEAIRIAAPMPHGLRSLLGPVPTFVHVLAFSVMSAAFVGRTYTRQLLLCVGWAAIEVVFELAQYPLVRDRLLRVSLLSSMPFIRSYLAGGTFDCADILAAIFGASLAGLFLRSTWSRSQ